MNWYSTSVYTNCCYKIKIKFTLTLMLSIFISNRWWIDLISFKTWQLRPQVLHRKGKSNETNFKYKVKHKNFRKEMCFITQNFWNVPNLVCSLYYSFPLYPHRMHNAQFLTSTKSSILSAHDSLWIMVSAPREATRILTVDR